MSFEVNNSLRLQGVLQQPMVAYREEWPSMRCATSEASVSAARWFLPVACFLEH